MSDNIAINGRANKTKSTFRMEYSAGINIQAKPERVWALMTNAADFPRWNSTVKSIEGKIISGGTIKLVAVISPTRTFNLKIIEYVPQKKMVWSDGNAMFKGVRTYIFTSKADGSTDFSMAEEYTGLMMPMIAGSLPDFTSTFEKYLSDLKRKQNENRFVHKYLNEPRPRIRGSFVFALRDGYNSLDAKSFPLRIGILGAAKVVSYTLALPARAVPEVQITAIAARNPIRAKRFARLFRIPHVHPTYEDLLADPEIDAIYNPLPNGLHAEWTIKALHAGKHVLCEKPFASNARQATEMAKVAKETGLVLSEAFAYRNHPLAARMKEIVANDLGRIQSVEARFCFLLLNFSNVRYRYDLAGGALMDAGCYPVSMVRYLMGEEPEVVHAQARQIKPNVNSRMQAGLSFPSGAKGHITCDMLSPRLFNSFLHVKGEAGEMKVFGPFQPSWFHWMIVRTSKRTWRGNIRGENIYTLQLRAFANAVRSGDPLKTPADDAVSTMRVIDSIYEKAGLKLRGE